jgi:hypothetical protein
MALNNDYKFTGVKTVNVYSIPTVALTDYSRTGTNRYGTPTDVEDETQELICSQDKSFSKVIDKGDAKDQQYLKKAGRVVALMIKEQGIPMTDKYGFAKLAAGAGKTVNESAPTKSTIVERIATGTEYMDDEEVPQDGRTLYAPAATCKLIRLSPEFTGIEALGKKAIGKGVVGEIDDMEVVKVPKSRFPEGVNFMIVHKSAACMPIKIDDTKIHQDPPGISGNLLEGRQSYDCFVYEKRAKGIYVDKTNG